MASTYSPQDAIALVSQYAHGAPLTVPAPSIVDQVNGIMWRYYPWGWSIASLNQTNLVQLTQGSGSPPTGGAQFTGNQQDYLITGLWFNYPINLQVGGVTTANYGGGFIATDFTLAFPNVTINLKYPHNLPLGTTLAGTVGTTNHSTFPTTAWAGNPVTITNIPSQFQILGTVTNGALSTLTQGDPQILRPLKMRIARLDTNPPEYRELAALGNLSPELSRTAGIDTMTAIGWFGSQGFFRFALAPQVSLGQIIQLLGEYQVLPLKITQANLSTPFPFPDHYFNVLDAGLLWRVYQLIDDPRAGGAQMSRNGQMVEQFTGQFGVFMSMLKEMARTEDLSAGDEFRYPETSLGVGRSYWPGLYGV